MTLLAAYVSLCFSFLSPFFEENRNEKSDCVSDWLDNLYNRLGLFIQHLDSKRQSGDLRYLLRRKQLHN